MAGWEYAGDYIGLIVGIDEYKGKDVLESAVRGANAIADLLETDGDAERTPRWHLRRIVTKKESVAPKIEAALQDLVSVCAAKHVLFWFSGHGSAPYGNLLLDARRHTYLASQAVIDRLNACPAKSVTIILDCCFSGSMGDEPQIFTSGPVPAGPPGARIRENLAVLTACRGSEETPDGEGHSPFTSLLLAGLKKGAADHQGVISIVDLFSYVSGYFLPSEPRPQLKINMTDEPLVLRRVEPRVPEHVLDKLVEWFPDPDLPKTLEEGHEGKRPQWPIKERTPLQREFDEIGSVRNLGMIESVRREKGEEEPLYWVALRGGDIQLTEVGKWFWAKVHRRRGRDR